MLPLGATAVSIAKSNSTGGSVAVSFPQFHVYSCLYKLLYGFFFFAFQYM